MRSKVQKSYIPENDFAFYPAIQTKKHYLKTNSPIQPHNRPSILLETLKLIYAIHLC